MCYYILGTGDLARNYRLTRCHSFQHYPWSPLGLGRQSLSSRDPVDHLLQRCAGAGDNLDGWDDEDVVHDCVMKMISAQESMPYSEHREACQSSQTQDPAAYRSRGVLIFAWCLALPQGTCQGWRRLPAGRRPPEFPCHRTGVTQRLLDVFTRDSVRIADPVESGFLELVAHVVLLECNERPDRALPAGVLDGGRTADIPVENRSRELMTPDVPFRINDDKLYD